MSSVTAWRRISARLTCDRQPLDGDGIGAPPLISIGVELSASLVMVPRPSPSLIDRRRLQIALLQFLGDLPCGDAGSPS
jgi:hypothetical protein